MNPLDFLKGILPDSLIKIDNRKIEIKNSEVIVGDNTINDPEIIKKIYDKLAEYKNKNTLPINIVHEDIADDFFEYEELSIREKENLRRLRKVLPKEEIECIMMARRVSIAWEKKNNLLAENLLSQLEKNHPKKGKKVLNLITAEYFDKLIIPMIDSFNSQYGEVECNEKYQRFYHELLEFFPTAVFVGNNTTEEKIKEELDKRFRLKGLPFIRIHSMGDENIQKVERVVSIYGKNRNLNIQDNRFTSPSGIKAQMLEIRYN